MTTGPKPFGVFTQSGENPTEEDIELAAKLSRRVENSQALSGLRSVFGSVPLENGGYIHSFNIGGVTKNIVVRNNGSSKEEEEELPDYFSVPMLYSGRVVTTRVLDKQPVELSITKGTQKRLVNYAKDKDPAPATQKLMRFVVNLGLYGSEFMPKEQTQWITTQFAQHRPTWFSGSLAKVVQIVTGYGKQKFTDGSKEEIKELTKKEIIRITLPDDVKEAVAKELDGYELLGCTGLPPDDGTIQFDYKFYSTMGVVFAEDKTPWVVRIRTGEVLAMPLPMIPATTTKAFKKYMEEVEDEEILAILDLFGGMPSGEGFPLPTALDAWKKAGVIIKLCDTADFYSNMSLSGSELGWAFSETTNQAAHVCYTYGDDGMQRAKYYKFKAQIGKIKKPDKKGDVDSESRIAAWKDLAEDKDYDKIKDAIAFKMRRSSASGNAAFWKNLQLAPIATGSGSVTKVSEGRVWSPAKFQFQPQLKLPNVAFGGCVSHDFNPDGNRMRPYPKASQRFDTIVFVYYIGDTLKTVRFCNDPREEEDPPTDDFEECMAIGSWTSRSCSGKTRMYGQFYTTDNDGREAIPDSVTTTKIKGEYLGVSKRWGRIDYPYMEGEMTRQHYFMTTTATDHAESNSLVIGTCVPFLNRSAVLYAEQRGGGTGWDSWAQTKYHMNDAYSYNIWTFDWLGHWVGPLCDGVHNQKPYPHAGIPVYVCKENIQTEGPCVDYINKGPYANVNEDVTYERISGFNPKGPASLMAPVGPNPKPGVFHPSKEKPHIEKLSLSYATEPWELCKYTDGWYYCGSPEKIGGVFYREASKNCMGETEYFVAMEFTGSAFEYLKKGKSLVVPPDTKACSCLIGVINE